MKKLLLVPFLAVTLALPLVGGEEAAQTEPAKVEQSASPQQKLIDEILSDYRAGKYNTFLKKADSDYQEAENKWKNNDLLEQRKKLSTVVHDYGIDKTDAFKTQIATLHENQDRELVEICLSNPNKKISHEVRDMIFFSPSKQEVESIEFIHGLSLKFKGDGTTPIENKLINIDTEFWLKGLSLEIAKTQNKVNDETFQKQYLILQLEKVKQMEEACQGDLVDVKIKSYVETASSVLPKVYASASTRKHLAALGKGKIAPQSAIEQEMQVVMAKYLQKEETLTEKHFPSN